MKSRNRRRRSEAVTRHGGRQTGDRKEETGRRGTGQDEGVRSEPTREKEEKFERKREKKRRCSDEML